METQHTICQWTADVFGTSGSTIRAAVRAHEEAIELLRALTSEQYDKAPAECADVVIVMCRVAERRRETLDWRLTPPGRKDRGRALIYAARASAALGAMINGLADEHRSAVSASEVVRYVAACAAWLGVDLQTEIDRKMEINRARVWTVGADGHGYHVREKDAGAITLIVSEGAKITASLVPAIDDDPDRVCYCIETDEPHIRRRGCITGYDDAGREIREGGS
jgi:NTP pyrophosphatase (non-canonical NTP hydrolase)